MHSSCPALQSDYLNYKIPEEIKSRGKVQVQEFREWFETVKHLLNEQPEVFTLRLQTKWGVKANPKAIKRNNTPHNEINNLSLKEMEKQIDELLKSAQEYYESSTKHTAILDEFSHISFLANSSKPIIRNTTGFSADEIREVLDEYNKCYKTPLIKYLISYYRLQFNPQIDIDHPFLEQLGFRPCQRCHHKNFDTSMTRPGPLKIIYESDEGLIEEPPSFGQYSGTYAQDIEGLSDNFIDDVLGGDPDAYWNID